MLRTAPRVTCTRQILYAALLELLPGARTRAPARPGRVPAGMGVLIPPGGAPARPPRARARGDGRSHPPRGRRTGDAAVSSACAALFNMTGFAYCPLHLIEVSALTNYYNQASAGTLHLI